MIFILVCIFLYYFLKRDVQPVQLDYLIWINLDRCIQRRNMMQSLLTEFGDIPKIRMSAVDGKNPRHVQSFESLIKNRNKNHSNYEYACLLSHLNTIQQFWNSNKTTALIMEDDMTLEFKPYWVTRTLSEYITNAPKKWDILQLCYISDLTPPSIYSLWNPLYFSTGAYVINRKGASKIMKMYINNMWNLPTNESHNADSLIYKLCNTYTSRIPFFIYPSDNDSEIHQTHISFHNKSKKQIIHIINNQV